jgi:hypothetical protein
LSSLECVAMAAGDDDCEWRLVNAAASIKLELTVTLAWHNLCFRPDEDILRIWQELDIRITIMLWRKGGR